MELVKCYTIKDIEDSKGKVVRNTNGTISVYMYNNQGQFAPVFLQRECCEKLQYDNSNNLLNNGIFYDERTQKCLWSKSYLSACTYDEIFNIVLNPKGNDGSIFVDTPDAVSTLSIDFDYLIKFNCDDLNQILNGDTTCSDTVNLLENIGATMQVNVVKIMNSFPQTVSVYEEQFFKPVGQGNLYNYLKSGNTNSGFFICGRISGDTTGTSCIPINLYDIDYNDKKIDCVGPINQLQSILFQESGLDDTSDLEFLNNINGNVFGPNWLHHHTEITDQEILTGITNEKIKLTFRVSGSCIDFCLLLDNIQMDQKTNYVSKKEIFISESPGFELDRIIDNKKSWVKITERQNRRYKITNISGNTSIRNTNYTLDDSRQVINTKEIDLDIDIASAIETDIWTFILDNPCLLTGVTVGTTTKTKYAYSPITLSCGTVTYCASNYCGDAPIDLTSLLISPLSSVTTLEDFKYYATSELIDVKNRKIITQYPTLRLLYDRYYNLSGFCGNISSRFDYYKMSNFADLIGYYWSDLIEQVVPSTTIWGATRIYGNTIFDTPKFPYKGYSSFFGANRFRRYQVLSPVTGESCNASATTKVIYGTNANATNTLYFSVGGQSNFSRTFLIQKNSGSEFIGFINTNGDGDYIFDECSLVVTISGIKPSSGLGCPAGYTANYITNRCEKSITANTINNGTATITAGDTNPAYGVYGTVFYPDLATLSLPVRYNGLSSLIDANSNIIRPLNLVNTGTFWYNSGNYSNGRLNQNGLFPVTSEYRGFTKCVTVPSSKVYYVGIGADNFALVKLDGITIVDFTTNADTANFRYWNVFPVFLNAGEHTIEMFGKNQSSAAAFGAEIYDPSSYQVLTAATNTSQAGVIFTTNGLVGSTWTLGTTAGLSCPTYLQSSYINDCSGSYLCYGITATPFTTIASNNGSLTANVFGAFGTISYLWNNGQTTQTINNLSADTYTVTVTDNGLDGCTATASLNLENAICDLGLSCTLVKPQFNQSNGSITAIAVRGTPPYSYVWDTTPVQTGATATGLSDGIYTVTVTDSLSCGQTQIVTLTEEPCNCVVSFASQNPTVLGLSDGTATVTPTGGIAPYTFSWNTTPVQTGATATGLSAGTYSVTVTDSIGCSQSGNVTLVSPPCGISCNLGVTNSTFGQANGSIISSVSNAISPITYSWSNGATTSSITGLTAGSYTLIVTDAVGCTTSKTAIITTTNCNLNISLTATNSSIGQANGSIISSVSNGIAPYVYSWNTTPPQSGSSISGLTAGTFTVTVTDSVGCVTSATATVYSQSCNLTVNGSVTNPTIYGLNNGFITTSLIGGTAPFSYSWNTIPVQTGSTLTGLTGGNFTVTVTDANSCVSIFNGIVTPPPCAINTTLNIKHSVYGGQNGQITATTSGGIAPYTFVWNTIPVQSDSGTSLSIATGLTAGSYTVIVTDSVGCTGSTIGTVTSSTCNLNALLTPSDPTIYGLNDGYITSSVNGGTPPYHYLWNTTPVQSGATATGLTGGTYILLVTDFFGCVTADTATVTPPPCNIYVSLTPTNDLYSSGTGTISSLVAGGIPPYSYSWNTVPNTWSGVTVQTGTTATGLTAGTYVLSVTDSVGCKKSAMATVSATPCDLTFIFTSTASTAYSGNGIANVFVSGGVSPYNYIWNTNPIQYGPTATGLTGGSYSVTAVDLSGCTDSASTVVTNCLYSGVVLTTGATINKANGAARIILDNEVANPYTVVWNSTPVKSGTTATGLTAGTYVATVTDANLCVKSFTGVVSSITTTLCLVSGVTSFIDSPACGVVNDQTNVYTITHYDPITNTPSPAPDTFSWTYETYTNPGQGSPYYTYYTLTIPSGSTSDSIAIPITYSYENIGIESMSIASENPDVDPMIILPPDSGTCYTDFTSVLSVSGPTNSGYSFCVLNQTQFTASGCSACGGSVFTGTSSGDIATIIVINQSTDVVVTNIQVNGVDVAYYSNTQFPNYPLDYSVYRTNQIGYFTIVVTYSYSNSSQSLELSSGYDFQCINVPATNFISYAVVTNDTITLTINNTVCS